MAEEVLGVDFEVHGGGSDLVFPHHENEIAQTEAARGKPLARALDAQRHGADGRREDGQVGGQHPLAARRARRVRPRRVRHVDGGRPLPQAGRVLRGGARGGGPRGGARSRLGAPAGPRGAGRAGAGRVAERFFDALADDFNTPAARAALFDWVAEANRRLDAGERVGPGRLGEMLCALGAREPARSADDEAPEELERLAAEREEARAARDFDARRPTARRAGRRGLGDPRHPGGRPARAPGRDRLRAQPRARGAARARGACSGCAPPSGPRARCGSATWRCTSTDRGEIEERCGSPDHQGVCAEVGPYPYADAGLAARAPTTRSCSASTRCRTRTTSARSAAWPRAPAAAGVVLPERRSAEVTPAVCKASAGAVEHLPIARVRNLADWLAKAKEREGLGVRGRRRRVRAVRPPGLQRAGGAGARARRGAGCARAWPRRCDELVRLPVRGKVGSLNVSTAAAALVYGILHCAGETLTGLHN